MDRRGVFYLSRLQVQTLVFDQLGETLDMPRVLHAHGPSSIDLSVFMGDKHRLPVRLLAAPVEPHVAKERRRRLKLDARKRCQLVSKKRLALADWTILVTNTPLDLLSLVLARARWHIELLFKLWKQHGQIDARGTRKPWRALCELYAKLLAMLVLHWLMVVTCWSYPDRSLVKGAHTVQGYALMLASAMGGFIHLATAIEPVSRTIGAGCRINPRRRKPNTYQLLLGVSRGA